MNVIVALLGCILVFFFLPVILELFLGILELLLAVVIAVFSIFGFVIEGAVILFGTFLGFFGGLLACTCEYFIDGIYGFDEGIAKIKTWACNHPKGASTLVLLMLLPLLVLLAYGLHMLGVAPEAFQPSLQR